MDNIRIEKKLTTRTRGLERYFNEVNKYKLISVEREVELAEKIKHGDKDALQELINANLKFVISIAKQYAAYEPDLLLDLISQGNIGLIDAAKTYDATRGFKFISYAVWHIRKEILYYLMYNKRTIKVPQNVGTAINKVKKISQKFEQEHERDIEPEELKDIFLEMKDKDSAAVDFQKAYSHINGPTSLDAPINEDGVELSELIASDDRSPSFIKTEGLDKLKKLIEHSLNPRYAKIVSQRLGLEDGYPLSWERIAELHERTPTMMQTIYNKSIRLMRRNAIVHGITMGDFEF